MDEAPVVLKDFLNYMQTIRGKSPNTIKEYYYDLRLFLRFIKIQKGITNQDIEFETIEIKDVTIDLIEKITLSDLYSYMSFVNRKRYNHSSSRARKVASIRSFFNYLSNKAKLLDYNPASELESPKILKTLPKYLNIDESKKLLNIIDGKNKERDFAIVILFLNCGLRLSELVSINLKNIRNNTLSIIGKGGKERTIYLNSACQKALLLYTNIRPVEGVKDKEALFLSERKKRISAKTVQYLVKKYIKLSGLDESKYSVHKLRHTAATLMYRHGNVDIRSLQEILGHESISTTEIYTHVDNKDLQNAVEKNPLANFEKECSNESEDE